MDISLDLSEIDTDESVEVSYDRESDNGSHIEVHKKRLSDDDALESIGNHHQPGESFQTRDVVTENDEFQPSMHSDSSMDLKKKPQSVLSIMNAAAMFTRPLEAISDTVEEQINASLDSRLSCCQWLEEMAESIQKSPTKRTEALTMPDVANGSSSSSICNCPFESKASQRNPRSKDNDNPPYLLQTQSAESYDTTAVQKGVQTNQETVTKNEANEGLSFVIRNTPSLLSDSSEDENDNEKNDDSEEDGIYNGDITAVMDSFTEDGQGNAVSADVLVKDDNDDVLRQKVIEGNASDDVMLVRNGSKKSGLGQATIASGDILFVDATTDYDESVVENVSIDDSTDRGHDTNMPKNEENEDNPHCNTDATMEMLLHELDDYVGKNKIRYHDVSPEKLSWNESRPLSTKGFQESPSLPAAPSISISTRSEAASVVTPSTSPENATCSFESAEDGSDGLDASETDSDDGAAEFFLTPSCPSKKRLSFADDHGLELEQTHLLDPPPETAGRIVVLLLNPLERIFEFLHIECPYDESTTVQVLVEQLPALATMHIFQYTRFIGLARISSDTVGELSPQDATKYGNEPSTKSEKDDPLPSFLDSALLLGNVGFRNFELVFAVPEQYSCTDIVMQAYPLLLNGTITKALQTGRRSGRGLKPLKNGEQWYKDVRSKNVSCRDGQPNTVECNDDVMIHSYREWGVVADLADNVFIFGVEMADYVSTWEEMQQLADDDEDIVLEWADTVTDPSSSCTRDGSTTEKSWLRRALWLLVFLVLASTCLQVAFPVFSFYRSPCNIYRYQGHARLQ
ncbi:hypothetical protein IV203_016649 [Nitzschia inconspicua]|uniref:Uncharacterized protein n=1 Tax=Nitzschia inconspicua TaxID=303405 RepID=A0A9K3KQA0_9STRA|nr:hypothetical protein IV203_016649 [Nitzschia inconspicua]